MECYDIIISLASNVQQEENLWEARKRLQQILSDITFSQELWTDPIGRHQERKYLNQLAFAKSNWEADVLVEKLKEMELSMGRTAVCRAQGIVPIDLDLLLHGEQQFHLSDWERPYVKNLLHQASTESLHR